jgi:hypothetical protein
MACAFSSMLAMTQASPMGIGCATSIRKRFVERNRILNARILAWGAAEQPPPPGPADARVPESRVRGQSVQQR